MTHDDLVIWCDINAEQIAKHFLGTDAEVKKKTWEYPVSSGNKWGFVDLALHCLVRRPDEEGKLWEESLDIFIEAKPRIDSLGDLIRQLRRYQRSRAICVVATLDDRFRRTIEEQGFGFILATGGQMTFRI